MAHLLRLPLQVPSLERRPGCARRSSVRKTARPGFSLVEMAVVITIVGTLAAIAIPSYQSSQDKARNAAMQGNVKTVATALVQYAAENDGSFPRSPDAQDTDRGAAPYSPSAIGLANYLVGGSLPSNPWSTIVQEEFTAPNGAPVVINSATELATEDGFAKRPGSYIGNGQLPVDGTPLTTDWGVYLYSRDAENQVTLLYGIGKKLDDAIVAGSHANETGNAGGGGGP
ncbi:MAG: prepilin-type N-terminal cleavage/methylation domain-containing protein [Candidatus Sericytochromatia bacterium]|nr:prepilin-type N-terminal cleavage/methylation domain-containing protein [Candidatus Sericytochromatia bacterium]